MRYKFLNMRASAAMKLLSAGCAGFLLGMPGALVDGKKHVYDHRTGDDFGVEKMDCINKGVERYMEIEVFDKNFRPIIDSRYTQVADECGRPLAAGEGIEWTMFYDWNVNGTLEGDALGRLQLDMYVCSPNGYFELEVTVRSDNGFDENGNANSMNRVAWEIEYGPDQYHIWDTLNTPFHRFRKNFFELRANGATEAQRPYAPIPPFCDGCDGEVYKWPYDDAEGYYSKLLTGPFPPLKCPNLYPSGVDYVGCFGEQVGWTQMAAPPTGTDADSMNDNDDAERFRMYDGLTQNNVDGVDLGLATPGVMYPQKCKDMCSGFSFFGLSKATECVCGNAITGTNVPNCDLKDDNSIPEYQYLCSGDPAFLCGTDTMYEIYSLDGSTGPSDTPAPTDETPAPITDETPAPTTEETPSPVPTGAGGYVNLGCARERPPSFQVMTDGPFKETPMSAEICYGICTDKDPSFVYFGTENGNQCWCTKNLPGMRLNFHKCTTDCAGTTSGEICGGRNAITVYEITDDVPPTTPSPVDGTPSPVDETPSPVDETPSPVPDAGGSYEALGCWRDPQDGNRVLDDLVSVVDETMSADICFEKCAGYTYFGMQFNYQCWCGNSFDASKERQRPDDKCNRPCTGNTDLFCGGYDHIQLYQIN